jgi:hypothetical protein
LRIVYDIGWQHLMSQASRHHLNRGQPFGQHAQQIPLLQRNAALSRAKIRPGRMQENRTPPPAHNRRIIPTQHTNHIVNRISAPKFFMPRRMRQFSLEQTQLILAVQVKWMPPSRLEQIF